MKLASLTDLQRRRIARAYDLMRTPDEHCTDISLVESAEELHQATYTDWSVERKLDVVRAVVSHPLCDFGTALKMFWLIENSWSVLQYGSRDDISSASQQRAFDELSWIESRLLSDFYSSRRIAFDPVEYLKSTWNHTAKIARQLPQILLQKSPGTPCSQDDLDFSMSHEEWRDLIRKELDYTIMCLQSLADNDALYEPYVEWFVRRNIQGNLTPGTGRVSWLKIKQFLRRLSNAFRPFTFPDRSCQNPSISDDQRRRLYRILETQILDEKHLPFVFEMESAEELHLLVMKLNWDDGEAEEILRAILNHPLCDYGTALQIYLGGNPDSYYERYSTRDEISHQYDVEGYELVELAEHKLIADQFASHRIRIQVNEFCDLERLSQKKLKRAIPLKLLLDSPGELVVDDDLVFQPNSDDRYLKVLDIVGFCVYSIGRDAFGCPVYQSVARRFAEINLEGKRLKDPPVGGIGP